MQRRPRVVLMLGQEDTRLRALTAGAVGYLGKPFSEDSLLKCLNSALGDPCDKMPQS